MEFYLEHQSAVSGNICTFVLVSAISRFPRRCEGPARSHTLSRCVYVSTDYVCGRENTRGNPKESRTFGQSGEGLAPPGCSCLESQVSQMNKAIKKEPFVLRLHQTLVPAQPLWTDSPNWVCFGPRRSEKRPESLLHDGAALLLPPPTHQVASLQPSLCGRN